MPRVATSAALAARRMISSYPRVSENGSSLLPTAEEKAHVPRHEADAEEERRSLLPPRTGDTVQQRVASGGRRARVVKATFYGVQVFYSFFIM